MSGIFGIVNLDGAPVDRPLLERMAKATARRGPDANAIWCCGAVGLGHALLRIAGEPEDEAQPRTLDGQVWVTADARIDGRSELIRSLRAAGRRLAPVASHAELILHAYAVFGESFLQHLIGDFAFALWDGRSNTLVCARDHFGVRPFFYANTPSAFVFGTELDAVLEYTSVSTDLDELAIGDFLLFGASQNPDLSIYRDVRRLPAASQINLTKEALRVSRYWDVPPPRELGCRDYAECVERFEEVFSIAVTDRAPPSAVAIELSGGMDSTSIGAALAKDSRGAGRAVTAYTNSCGSLVPEDREAEYARLVASHLGIPIVEQASSKYALFERCEQPVLVTQEPSGIALLAAQYDTFSRIAASDTRVLLTGHGGDAAFGGASAGPRESWWPAHALRQLVETYRYVRHTGTLRGLGLHSMLMKALGRSPSWLPDFPDWINADFANRTDLHDRWQTGWKIIRESVGIQRQLALPWLTNIFESYEVLRLPLVVRHPYFDVRLVDLLVGLPNHMTFGKQILRDAMHGKLPEEIRRRPKTGLSGDHVRARFTAGRICIPMERRLNLVEGNYVDRERYEQAFVRYLDGEGSKSTWTSYYMVSPIALNNWLLQNTTHNGTGFPYDE
jgi:asparagine synthase (glutamine-hydrolysing)